VSAKKLLVLILPAVGQVQALIRDPTVLTEGAMGLLERVRELPAEASGEKPASLGGAVGGKG
jgi:hypothetical protein